ncbi:High affinity immunoglobulin epsilon receptor subunit gamma [Chelonia mydas]|nr:High affinity immunoglobulin epsilon receptor subunit gamma [Chelonia mydas]
MFPALKASCPLTLTWAAREPGPARMLQPANPGIGQLLHSPANARIAVTRSVPWNARSCWAWRDDGSAAPRAAFPLPLTRKLTTPLLPAEALAEPGLCYVLDAILFIYGIILTVLYCRLKLQIRNASKAVPSTAYSQKEEGIYTGLSAQNQETYETLRTKPN